jgi:hypothetical protein
VCEYPNVSYGPVPVDVPLPSGPWFSPDGSLRQFEPTDWGPLVEAANPPYWRFGSCPLHDLAGAVYDWARVCWPPFVYTGQIIVKEAGGVLSIGSGLRISQEHVLTAASVLRYALDRGVEVRFVAPGIAGERVGVDRKIVRWEQPKAGAVFGGACGSPAQLVSEDSSDLALCWLEQIASEAIVDERTLVLPGATPTAQQVRESALAGTQIEGLIVSSWLVEERGGAVPSLHAMRSFLSAVPVSGSVVIANVPHAQGTYPVGGFGTVRDLPYTAMYDAGSPLVVVGPGNRPVVIGVVSCVLDDPGQGVIYRATRVDRWAGWLHGLIEPAPPVPPTPPEPPLPPGPDGQPPRESSSPGAGGSGGVSPVWVLAGVLGAVLVIGGIALGGR